MRVTGKSITDEQIRELYDASLITFDRLYRAVHWERPIGFSRFHYTRQRAGARQLCADIYNARKPK